VDDHDIHEIAEDVLADLARVGEEDADAGLLGDYQAPIGQET
jgi:hypothetical protein